MGLRTRRALVAGAICLALTVPAHSTYASGADESPDGWVADLVDRAEQVSASPLDRDALAEVFAASGEAESERIIATQLVAETVLVGSTVTQAEPVPLPAGGSASSAPGVLATGCWSSSKRWESHNAAGSTLCAYSVALFWCAEGSRVTSAAFDGADGTAHLAGWSYGGVQASDGGVRNGQGRAYAKHEFTLVLGGRVIAQETPCARVNGRADGTSTGSTDCGLG